WQLLDHITSFDWSSDTLLGAAHSRHWTIAATKPATVCSAGSAATLRPCLLTDCDVIGPIVAMRTFFSASPPTNLTRLSTAEELVKVTQSGGGRVEKTWRARSATPSGGAFRYASTT